MSEVESVTWLLPVRNGMPFLPETLGSIEAQLGVRGQILARDDGSTDGSVEELEKWIPSRLPGQIVRGASKGIGTSLAILTEMAGTEFCARIDADDVNAPDRLQLQIEYMHSHPEIAAVGGQVDRLSIAGENLGPQRRFPLDHKNIIVSMLYRTPLAHPTVLFRRSSVMSAGNYRPVEFEDYDLWVRLARHHKLANLTNTVLQYRVPPDGGYYRRKVAEGIRVGTEIQSDALLNLFGAAGAEIGRLRERSHPMALLPLLRIALHLSRTQSIPLREILSLPSFSEALATLARRTDFSPRLWRKLFGPRANDEMSSLLGRSAA